jgi:hypothetical protein
MPRDIQTAFSAGELSPSLHSHADLNKYKAGLAKCENFLVLAQGGATTRPGLEYISTVENINDKSRLIPFQFNTEQTYALVFTDMKMRVIRDGGMVLEPNQPITGATQANPVVITCVGHGYATNDDVFISGVGGMDEINGRFFRIVVLGPNTFQLFLEDGTGYDAYIAFGEVGRVFTLTTPYPDGALRTLKYTQSADVMTITHPSYQIRNLSRTSHYNWTLTSVLFLSPIAPPTTGFTITQVGTASGSPNKVYHYVVTSVDGDGKESLQSAVFDSGSVNALGPTWGNKLTWNAVTGAQYYNVYKEFSIDTGIYGWLGEAETAQFVDYNFGPDMSYTPPQWKTPFNGANKYPSCTTYHQQRQWFGATNNNPDTMWATRTADFTNMNTSRPTRSDDAIEATLSAREVNEIRHMVSLDELIVFTSGGEWKIQADSDGVITPANLNPRTQGFRGSSHVPPVVIGDTALFVQENGSRVRDLKYAFEDDKYTGNDLTILARHLFEGHNIIDWCFSQDPYSLVWAVRDDGVLLCLTYLQEHDVYAWTRHTTDGEFKSICSIQEGDENAVYVTVIRQVGGFALQNVERMRSRLFESATESFCVDSGLTFRARIVLIQAITNEVGGKVTAGLHDLANGDIVTISGVEGMTEVNDKFYQVYDSVALSTFRLKEMNGTPLDTTDYGVYTSGGQVNYTTKTITKLGHLIGRSVVALCDGNVEKDLVVSGDGTVTLSNWSSVVTIGLPYVCDMETLEVSFQNDVLQSRKKQVPRVAIRVEKTRGLQVGPNFNEMYEFKERSAADDYSNLSLVTGQQIQEMATGWNDYGKVCIRQDNPLPATVLAIIPEIEVSA